MGPAVIRSFLAAACVMLAACAADRPPAATAATARAVAETAAQASVQAGARVCRQLHVGISEREWVRGTVLDVKGDEILVRIDDPGHFLHVLRGVTVAKNALIIDAITAWTRCV
jgi:hypothetical protein